MGEVRTLPDYATGLDRSIVAQIVAVPGEVGQEVRTLEGVIGHQSGQIKCVYAPELTATAA